MHLYASVAYCSNGDIMFVHPGFCSLPDIFLLLHKNTEWILMKLTRGNHYYEQIK